MDSQTVQDIPEGPKSDPRRVSCAPRRGRWPGQRECDAPGVRGLDGFYGGGNEGVPEEGLPGDECEEELDAAAAAGGAAPVAAYAWSLDHGPFLEGDPAVEAAAAAAAETAAEASAAWQAAEKIRGAANEAYKARPGLFSLFGGVVGKGRSPH